ncbi:MAG: type II toxin-antitoxin system RelE/ParE family toxin [Chloroflexi bacterium]|nr:type II toxin-antitoxin system RelE/ParE family toxin [Chloroflexota bacterium]
MADYSITFTRSARKEIEALEEKIVKRILPDIESLAKTPRPKGCKKLKGAKDLWRIRIGDYRVVYHIYDDKKMVDVTVVRHRRKAYE